MSYLSTPSIADVLRVRPFLFLWGSQIFSQVAFNMLNFVLVFRVYQLTQKSTAVSALVLSFILPQLVLSLFAGVFVDRFNKKMVMLWSNIIRGLAILPLVALEANLVIVYGSAFAVATVTQFFLPAEVPMIPSLVRKKLLLPANSLFTITLYGSIIVGYILAGPSLKYLGVTMTFLITAFLFVGASLFNSLLPGGNGADIIKTNLERISNGITTSRLLRVFYNDIGEVLFEILKAKALFVAIILMTISQTVVVILGVLLPGYAATVLSIAVEDSSLAILAPCALGMVIGSFFVGQIGSRIDKNRLVTPGVLFSGLMLFLLPIFSRVANPNVFVSVYSYLPFDLILLVIGTCFFLGFFNAMVIVPANTIVQEKTDEAMRGRAYGFFNALSALLSLIPVVLAGYFSDIFGVGRVLTVIGIIIMILALYRLFKQ